MGVDQSLRVLREMQKFLSLLVETFKTLVQMDGQASLNTTLVRFCQLPSGLLETWLPLLSTLYGTGHMKRLYGLATEHLSKP